MTLDNGEMTLRDNDNKAAKLRFQLNPETTPFQIDMFDDSGLIPGIYKLEAVPRPELTICFNRAKEGRVRPTDFKTNGNEDILLLTFWPEK
jgi:uncharacterized protein (TIGR03067 family)